MQLQQSPFLDIFPDQRIRATLQLMSLSPDEHVTRARALEICQRQGLKAYIAGTIVKFDRNYSITLEALNATLSLLWPLAHLSLARATEVQGDSVQARKAYESFFALWKDADVDIPILVAAKKEYERLK